MMMMRRLLFLRGGNHVYRRLSRSLSECVHTLRLSVSQNSQTLKCVLLSDDTERLRETERERLSERERCDVLKTSVVVRKEWCV
jgi:hypothetical protein